MENTLSGFYDFCVATGMKSKSAGKYCDRIRLFSNHFGQPPDAIADLNGVFSRFESNGFAEATKNIYKITMRKYLKYKVGRIPAKMKPYLKIREYYIVRPLKVSLSESEMKRVIAMCRTPKEKAAIAILMETGCRVGELLGARIHDVSFDKLGALIITEGKRRTLRRIRIIRSAGLLRSYLKIVSKKPTDSLFDYTYDQIRNVFRCRINRRLHKHLSPHTFRKLAATRLANHMTEYQLCQVMGWVAGSRMARHYVFMSGRDTDPVLAKVNRGKWA